ncbi:MAG: hypothetical protein A2X08_06205 [Bacteroidetes bacterium GWA2_32_17]|nr:MAG: hypothetical protein A2X08_06205 [Bacteroidetes bacterium GWA2_32_17]
MILAKVIGNIVSTIKAKGYESKKIMVVQPIDFLRNNNGTSFLAIDAVQAGVGDTVLVLEEGNSAREIINEPDTFTIRTVIAGIVDEISI